MQLYQFSRASMSTTIDKAAYLNIINYRILAYCGADSIYLPSDMVKNKQ